MRHLAPLLLMLLAPVAEATAPGEWELVGELPDGTVLAVHPKGRLVRIDPGTGELRDAPADGVTTWVEVELDPTRTRFAGIDGDGRMVVCDLADGEFRVGDALTGFLQLHRIRWTSDGRHFVTWSESRTSSDDGRANRGAPPVRLWTRAGKLVWEGPPASDADVRPGHDELCVSAVDDEGVRLLVGWPEAAGGAGLVDAGLAGHVHSAAYSPDGARIAAAGGMPGTYDSGQPRFTPHLWILDAKTRALVVDRDLTGIDPFVSRGECIRWSPDGRWLGVSLGKGHAPGILAASDGSLRRSGSFRGGWMNASIHVAWLASGRLVSPMPHGLVLDPDPDAPAVEMPWQIREDALSLAGTNDFLCVAVHPTRRTNVARVDGASGEVLWSTQDDAAPPAKRERR